MIEFGKERMVEAIEDGKIVSVPEYYAMREGLIILKKPFEEPSYNRKSVSLEPAAPQPMQRKKRSILDLDKFRRPLNYSDNRVMMDLKDNFHWEVSKRRKERNLTRKQVAEAIGESEEHVKMIENGVLPHDNYIVINKVQNYLGLNLRKDGQDFSKPALQVQPKVEVFTEKKEEPKEESLILEDIQLLDEEPK